MIRKTCWVIFTILIGLFAVALSPIKNLLHLSGDFRSFVPYLGVLGALLVVSAMAARIGGLLKSFLILTGASAVGWPVGLYLHDPLLQFIPNEPFTYILVFYICPVAFIAGAVGTIIIGIRQLVSPR